MHDLHNIDKSKFRKGEYIGYAGGAWRIARDGGIWRATHRNLNDTFCCDTLGEVSARLDRLARAFHRVSTPPHDSHSDGI